MTCGDGVTKEPHLSPQHYELNTIQHACAGSDKSIGLQVILNGNVASKLGVSHCKDLTAPPRSVPSLFDGIAQNKAQTSSPKGGREGKFYKNNILSANLAGQQNPIK